jgi:hypothetical protein
VQQGVDNNFSREEEDSGGPGWQYGRRVKKRVTESAKDAFQCCFLSSKNVPLGIDTVDASKSISDGI